MMLKVTRRPKRAPVNAPSTKILPGEMNTSILTPHAGLVSGFLNAENWHGIGLVESTDTLHGSPGVYFAMDRLRCAPTSRYHAWMAYCLTTRRCSKFWNRTGSHWLGLTTTKIGWHRTNLVKPGLVFCHLLFGGLTLLWTGGGVNHHFAFVCVTIQVFQL